MRVHRTFGFVDVTGFTALTELEGDERAVDVLTAFRALLRDICSRRGVRIAKWLGDGVMLVCVDTRPLLESVLELHFVVGEVSGPVSTVSIRSGITSGHVLLLEGDDYVGHCVNVAARLCDLAPAGEALADVISAHPAKTLIVASSDMNHYESDQVTRVKDRRAIDQVLGVDPRGLYETVRHGQISMCGYCPATVMLTAARKLGATQAELIRYATSGDVSGDRDMVVGYAGIAVY